MIWPAMLFNLCVGLVCAAFLIRAARRYEQRADAMMAKLDEEVELSIRKWETTRDEIRASMRAKTDRSLAMMQTTIKKFQAMGSTES